MTNKMNFGIKLLSKIITVQLNSKLKTTINLDRCDYILVALHQRFIKAFKGICGMFNLIYAHLSVQYQCYM